MQTFSDGEIASISLVPCKVPAGTFVVTCNDVTVWDRTEQKRFPETKELKRLVRDLLNPNKDLGHSDNKEKADNVVLDLDDMDDEEAEEARKFFGVM